MTTDNQTAAAQKPPGRGLLGWTWFAIKWSFLLAMTAMWWWLIIPAWLLSKVFATGASASGGGGGYSYRSSYDDYDDSRRRAEQDRRDMARRQDFEDRYAAYNSTRM